MSNNVLTVNKLSKRKYNALRNHCGLAIYSRTFDAIINHLEPVLARISVADGLLLIQLHQSSYNQARAIGYREAV